jgi:hypothetical protein
VRPGNEGPRARDPRPDALSTTEGLALGEHRIRTGDGPGRGTYFHLASPPPERIERQDPTYSRCTLENVSSTNLAKVSLEFQQEVWAANRALAEALAEAEALLVSRFRRITVADVLTDAGRKSGRTE